MAVDFDGINDHVTMGDVLDFERTDPFSIVFWMRSTQATDGAIVSKEQSAGNFGGYIVWISTAQSGKIEFALVADAAGPPRLVVYETTSSTNDGAWHHVVYTYSGSSLASGVALYVDGASRSLTIAVDTLSSGSTLTAIALNLGIRNLTNLPWDGDLEDVRIFNRVLTAEEAAALGAGYRGPLGGEVGWWSCGDFAGVAHPDGTTLTTSNIMSDLSSNGNDGVPTNSPVARASEAPRMGTWI